MTLDEQARALAIAIMERPEGYDPALLIGFEREWYGANLPLILAALLEAKAQGMEEAAKLVCSRCRAGYPLQLNGGWHNDKQGHDTLVNNGCLASLIHERMQEAT